MRVAFVIDRYWPLITAASRVLDVVARFLLQEGHEVMVLTAQVDHLWPETITVRDVPVRRFGLDSWSLFGRKSLGQRIATWLDRHTDQWDVLVVCELLEGGHHVIQVADQIGRPTLMSCFESGSLAPISRLLEPPRSPSDESALTHSQSVPRRSLWLARNQWTVPDEAVATAVREIHPSANVVPWGLGIPELAEWTDSERRQVRTAICQSRGGFERYIAPPLIVYHGHCLPGPDARWLWQMLAGLCEQRADVCAWITGDGSAIHGLWRQANEAGLEDRIIFPGMFNDLSDLFAAADLIVLPQLERRLDHDWLTAIATGTPCLVANSIGTTQMLGKVKHLADFATTWSTVLPRDLDRWWEQAGQILDCPPAARRQVAQQHTELWRYHQERETLNHYLQLLIQTKEGS